MTSPIGQSPARGAETVAQRGSLSGPDIERVETIVNRTLLGVALNLIPALAGVGCALQAGAGRVVNLTSQVVRNVMHGVQSLVNRPEFASNLHQAQRVAVFGRVLFGDKLTTYVEELASYRRTLVGERTVDQGYSVESKTTAHKIFMGLGLSPAIRVLSHYLSEAPSESLAEHLVLDRELIANKSKEAGHGSVRSNLLKASGVAGIKFDPHMHGNLPYSLGTRTVDGKKVTMLRHALPTIEAIGGGVSVAPEYLAFLENCAFKEAKVLYCSLLNLDSQILPSAIAPDKDRTQVIYHLGEQYEGTFHFIRMPMDAPSNGKNADPTLSQVEKYETLDAYRNAIQEEVKKAINHPGDTTNEFIFGSREITDVLCKKIDGASVYERILTFAHDVIRDLYAEPGESMLFENQKKQALMMLFSSILRSVLIKELNIQYYNNTCKDTTDRSVAHILSDEVLVHFLRGDLSEHAIDVRRSAAWPAFMAKGEAIKIKGRLDWAVSLVELIEKASKSDFQGQIPRGKIIEKYQEFGFPVEGEFVYNYPEINYPQSEEEIRRVAKENRGERTISMEVSIDVTRDVDSQVIEQALLRLEAEYSLSFTPSRIETKEGIIKRYYEAKDTNTDAKGADLEVSIQYRPLDDSTVEIKITAKLTEAEVIESATNSDIDHDPIL